jgi:hypothetical protein
MEKFTIKHYCNDPHPTLKGNGFDGLVIGDYREEAEEFIEFVNKLIENQIPPTYKNELQTECTHTTACHCPQCLINIGLGNKY